MTADYKSLRKLVVSKPFQGRMISVQRVSHTTCVIVDGVTQISEDMIALHFENPRRSGGGEVKAVSKHDDFAIVEFKDRNGRLCTEWVWLDLVYLPQTDYAFCL